MAAIPELFWRLFPDVRPQERPRFLFFAALATLVSLAQTLGLAGAEALFMSKLRASLLPYAFIGASIATVLGSVLYAARVGSARNDSLFVQMLTGAGAALAVASALVQGGPGWIPGFLFCFWFVTQAIFVSHLWTFTADYFDASASKRLIPLLTIGASLGGVLGGGAAMSTSQALGAQSLIAGWAACLLAGAAMLRIGRRRLRGWGPIEIEEADETSVEGIQGAIRYMRASKLGFALFASAIGMTLALVVARYMWLDIFAREYPGSDDLGAFIGVFLMATNVVEIAIEVAVVPLLIRRFGVPSTNLVHPALTIASFAGLALSGNLVAGAVARMNGEMLENALANPIRALLCNAIPVRFRGRVRVFLEGIVVYAAMSIGGVILLVWKRPDPFWLALAGVAASSIYLASNWLVRREYVRTLVDQLVDGRLDLTDLGSQIGDFEASRLADLWEQLLNTEGERPSASLLKMIPTLRSRGMLDPLVRAARHANPVVRRACVIELARTDNPEAQRTIVEALSDGDADVRLAAARAMERLPGGIPEHLNRRLVEDPSPPVRAQAAARGGAAGRTALEKMIASPDPADAVAALSVAPEILVESAVSRLHDPHPEIRAAALEFVARCRGYEPDLDEALDALGHANAGVRRAGVMLLANVDSDAALDALASAVADPAAQVRIAAEFALADLAEDGIRAVEKHLRSDDEKTVEAALRVVAQVGARTGTELWRQVLLGELRDRAHDLWYALIAQRGMADADSVSERFLRTALCDGVARDRRICFRILAHLEGEAIVRNVDKALRFGSDRAFGDALDVLSHLGDREVAQQLVLLHEKAPLEHRLDPIARSVAVPDDPTRLIEDATRSHSRWVRLGAGALRDRSRGRRPEEDSMERLLALKRIPLFNPLSLDQLEAVHQLTTEEEFLDGEVIMRQGQRGDRLYLLLEGRVDVFLNYGEPNERRLEPMEAVNYVGEMAVLDGGERSATIVSSGHSRLLSLDGNSLRELVMQMPEISFEIFSVLASRVRVAEKRLSDER